MVLLPLILSIYSKQVYHCHHLLDYESLYIFYQHVVKTPKVDSVHNNNIIVWAIHRAIGIAHAYQVREVQITANLYDWQE